MDFVFNKLEEQWENRRSLDPNMISLKRKLKELNGLKEDTEARRRTELQQPRKKLKTEVQIWLENVERVNGEIENLDGRISESNTLTRGLHTEDALKMIREVDELFQQGKFPESLVLDNPEWTGQVLYTSNLSGDAAKAYVEEIWQCLIDNEITKIGVWGMGGVGKTSIMKVINNQLLNETEKFSIVIWITVSKEMSVAKLQKDIASKVGVTFSGAEDEITRAGMLFETLSRKGRFVMILDDLWEKVSLETIGIPEPSVGRKLVLTTRSFDVCRQVGCCKVIKVKPLEESQAWDLFSEKVGRDILNTPGVEPIAKSIAKRCAGLPLGVVTVAACMKGIVDLFEWRNALKELTSRKKSVNGLEDEVFQQLRFSYDRLRDSKLQQCFLNCALFPEDFEIYERELVELWIDEGLVEEMDSRKAEYDRGYAMMNRLINNCLLEAFIDEDNMKCVKMHDLPREMALHMTSAEPRFLVKARMRLTEPPDVQEWSKDLVKVSLMDNWSLCVLYPPKVSPPKCPMLTTLLLRGCRIKSIPEGFFKHMGQLKNLDLSCNPIRRLPESISDLVNLTTLYLAWCDNLEHVPSLSKLCLLKKLDLEGTKIKEVPHGMENLSSLKYLSLKDTEKLEEIPNGILSRLSYLQQLFALGKLISGEEVRGLKKLEILEGRFGDLHNFVQANLHGRQELHKFVIHMYEGPYFVESSKTRKCIRLSGCDVIDQIIFPRNIKELCVGYCNFYCSEEYPLSCGNFSSLKYLDLYNCKNLKKLFSPNFFPLNLKSLSVFDCAELEEIIASRVESEERGIEFHFPQFKDIELQSLQKLKSICGMDGVMVCDSLKKIVVDFCPELKRMPFHLPQLDNARSSAAPLSLHIRIAPRESVEWDHPDAKSLFKEVPDESGEWDVTYCLEGRSS